MSNQEDPWAARVAAIFGKELPKPEVIPKLNAAAGLADMLRNADIRPLNSPVISSRFLQIAERERKRVSAMERPLFMESSSVLDPAYGSLPYRTAELVTKEGGLPREVKCNGRLYVKEEARLVLDEREWAALSTQPRLIIDRDSQGWKRGDYRVISGNWPAQISVAGEKFTLYRQGQYDVIGIFLSSDTLELDPYGTINFASACALCEDIVFMSFRLNEVEIMEGSALELIEKHLANVKISTCPSCDNKGKVS